MITDENCQTVEAWLVENCRRLGMRVESEDSDFFEAGGTSLTAVRLLSRVEAHFGVDALTPDELFEGSVLRQMANAIRNNAPKLESRGSR